MYVDRLHFNLSKLQSGGLASVSRLTVWLHKGPKHFQFRTLCSYELGLPGYGQGLVIFHKMGPMTRHDSLQQNDCL